MTSARIEPEYPEFLRDLWTKNNADAKNFRDNIRSYNSAMAFTSMGFAQGGGMDSIPAGGTAPYCFKIHGSIYHRISDAIPEPNRQAMYGQLYILDTSMSLGFLINKHSRD